jgi:hypothetical protein
MNNFHSNVNLAMNMAIKIVSLLHPPSLPPILQSKGNKLKVHLETIRKLHQPPCLFWKATPFFELLLYPLSP